MAPLETNLHSNIPTVQHKLSLPYGFKAMGWVNCAIFLSLLSIISAKSGKLGFDLLF